MAALKKPDKCGCGSTDLKRERDPERWVCLKCDTIVTSRRKKPQNGVCRVCGAKKKDVPFDNHGNICRSCKSDYNKEYGKKNAKEIREHHKKYYAENKTALRARANAYWQGSWTTYLSDRFNSIRNTASKRIDGRPRGLAFEITREDLYELAKKQDYKCAITGLPLLHEWGNMKSASVDRIDSNGGYTKDNIQLVCKCVNLMKNTNTDDDVKAFLDEYILRKGLHDD